MVPVAPSRERAMPPRVLAALFFVLLAGGAVATGSGGGYGYKHGGETGQALPPACARRRLAGDRGG